MLSIDGVASRGIPTCPYKWPNGQGDVAKFLEGEDNSSRWFKEHGRIYRLWAGMSPEMYVLAHLDALNNYLIRTHNPVTNMSTLTRDRVLTQSQDVKSVFKDSDLHTKAVNNDAGWLMGQLLGKCMGLVTGSEWRKSRASVGEHFTFKSTSQFIPRIVEITEAYFSDLHDDGRLRSHALLTPSKDLRLLPFWVVAEYIYGPLTPHARDQLESLIPLRESLFRTVIQGGMTRFKWGSWLPSPTNRCLQEFKEKWRKLNDDIYEESKRSDRSRVLGHMYESIHESGTSLENVLQTVDEMLFGNIDVTVGALSWIPILLAAAPTFTAELHEEIMTEERNNTGWAAYLARSDSLLTYSILEAARVRPIAAFQSHKRRPRRESPVAIRFPAEQTLSSIHAPSTSEIRIGGPTAVNIAPLDSGTRTWLKCDIITGASASGPVSAWANISLTLFFVPSLRTWSSLTPSVYCPAAIGTRTQRPGLLSQLLLFVARGGRH